MRTVLKVNLLFWSISCLNFQLKYNYLVFLSTVKMQNGIIYHLSVGWFPLDTGDEGLDPNEVEDEMHDKGHHQVLVNR
jgi:hypothetical protein